jgi:hypothetical protein
MFSRFRIDAMFERVDFIILCFAVKQSLVRRTRIQRGREYFIMGLDHD